MSDISDFNPPVSGGGGGGGGGTGIQPGDNVSLLQNDAGYVNATALANAGYITATDLATYADPSIDVPFAFDSMFSPLTKSIPRSLAENHYAHYIPVAEATEVHVLVEMAHTNAAPVAMELWQNVITSDPVAPPRKLRSVTLAPGESGFRVMDLQVSVVTNGSGPGAGEIETGHDYVLEVRAVPQNDPAAGDFIKVLNVRVHRSVAMA